MVFKINVGILQIQNSYLLKSYKDSKWHLFCFLLFLHFKPVAPASVFLLWAAKDFKDKKLYLKLSFPASLLC